LLSLRQSATIGQSRQRNVYTEANQRNENGSSSTTKER
jgi:hypothetical protein